MPNRSVLQKMPCELVHLSGVLEIFGWMLLRSRVFNETFPDDAADFTRTGKASTTPSHEIFQLSWSENALPPLQLNKPPVHSKQASHEVQFSYEPDTVFGSNCFTGWAFSPLRGFFCCHRHRLTWLSRPPPAARPPVRLLLPPLPPRLGLP